MHSAALQQRPDDSGFSDTLAVPGRLKGKRALITVGETSLGRALAVSFAREGADIALVCPPHVDASETRRQVVAEGVRCLLIEGDIRELDVCDRALDDTLTTFGGLDILVNNAAGNGRDTPVTAFGFATLYLSRNALRVMDDGATIINTAHGDDTIAAFTRSLSQVAARRGIRVNAVASTSQAAAVAASYVYLAGDDARQLNGQILSAGR